MGFGRPKVDGGMTMQEMQLMREEERSYMRQEQDRQFQQMREFEQERDQALLARQESERTREQQTLMAFQDAENLAIEESKKVEDEEDTGFNTFGQSLLANLAARPE